MPLEATDAPLTRSSTEKSKVQFRASILGLFLPTIVIALGYGLIWVGLFLTAQADTMLARLCMYVLLLGVPLLVAYGLLRYATIGVKIYGAHIKVHSGFPRRDPLDIPLAFIEDVNIAFGPLGRWTRSGTLRIVLSAKRNISISDIAHPHQVKLSIDKARGKLSEKTVPADE